MSLLKRIAFVHLPVALVSIAVGVGATITAQNVGVEELEVPPRVDMSDWRPSVAPKEIPAPARIIIIGIDDKSTAPYPAGLGKFSSWTRDYYAQVLERLNREDPKVIGSQQERH